MRLLRRIKVTVIMRALLLLHDGLIGDIIHFMRDKKGLISTPALLALMHGEKALAFLRQVCRVLVPSLKKTWRAWLFCVGHKRARPLSPSLCVRSHSLSSYTLQRRKICRRRCMRADFYIKRKKKSSHKRAMRLIAFEKNSCASIYS